MKQRKVNLQNFAGENILSREEMKNVLGGMAPPEFACSVSVNCVKTVYNSQTGTWGEVSTGSASCSGSGDCTTTSTGVSCPQSGGGTDTASCGAGSHAA